MNIHTAYHNKQADGRSKEIEGYIEKSMEWLMLKVAEDEGVVSSAIDFGGDYGYAAHILQSRYYVSQVTCVDPNGTNLLGVPVVPESMEAYVSPTAVDLVVFNHSIEHVENPYAALRNACLSLGREGYVFLGLPEASKPWALWEGHMSIWTEKFATNFLERAGFTIVASTTRCFREDNEEIWILGKRSCTSL